MAGTVDSGVPVCVPIDPIGWVYQRNCSLLHSDVHWGGSYVFRAVGFTGDFVSLDVAVPTQLEKSKLMSFAILVKPVALQAMMVSVKGRLNMKDGSTRYLLGGRQVPVDGGLLHLTGRGAVAFSEIESIVLEFAVPVEVGFVVTGASMRPAIVWMGK